MTNKNKVILGVFVVWAAIVTASYYQRAWSLFDSPLTDWLRSQYSLAFLLDFGRQLLNGTFNLKLPALAEALVRAGQGILGAGLVLAAAQALGWLLFSLMQWSPAHRVDRVLLRTSAGFGGIAYLSLGLAAMNAYHIHRLSALMGLMAAAGLIYLAVRRRSGGAGRQRAVEAPRHALPGLRLPERRPGDRLWQLVLLVAVCMALVGALAPETESEALWAHLRLPMQWLENGGPVPLSGEGLRYPYIWDLVYGAGLSISGVIAAKLLNFSAYLLSLALVYRMTSRFLPGANPWLAAALYASIPSILWLSSTTTVYLGVGLQIGLAVLSLLHYVERGERAWLAMAVLHLGMSLASGGVGLIALLASVGVLGAIKLGERRSWRSLAPAASLVASLGFALPWYLRAWLAGGAGAVSAWRSTLMQVEALDVLALPWQVTMQPERSGGAVGPLLLMLLPLLLLRRQGGRAEVLLVSFTALFGLWSALLLPSQGLLAILPAAPLLAGLGAAGASQLEAALRPHRLLSTGLHAALALLILLNLPPFTSLHTPQGGEGEIDLMYRLPLGVVVGYETEEDYLRRKVPSYNAWQYARHYLPVGSRVLTFRDADILYSQVDRVRFEAILEPETAWIDAVRSEKHIVERLRKLGVTHVLLSKGASADQRQEAALLLHPYFEDRYYQLLYEDDHYSLYELKNIQLQGSGI